MKHERIRSLKRLLGLWVQRTWLAKYVQRTALALSVILPCALTGCATVAPYERETLAREDMQLSRSADLTAGTQHATAYREGSAGATGAAGGGCGCN